MYSHLVLSVIVLNAIYIGVEADSAPPEERTPTVWMLFFVFDNAFCIFFTLELVIRFAAFKHKSDCCRDGWFKLDSLLLIMMMFETWVGNNE